MEFTFYDASHINEDELTSTSINKLKEKTDELDWSQSGLSGGEARQALLDRFREDINNENIHIINVTLEKFGKEISEDVLGNEKALKDEIAEIDELLYSLEDEEIADRLWAFDNEVIFIVGE